MAETDEDKRRRFTQWDLRAHWRTDVMAALAVMAAGYCLLFRNWPVAAVAFAILAAFCAALPRSDVWTKLPFGGGIGARQRGSQLKTPEVRTPEISEPLPAEDEPEPEDATR